MLTRITNLKNIDDLIELKTQHENFMKHIQVGERYHRLEINSMKLNVKTKSKKKKRERERMKRNKQSLQEIWDYVKKTNLCLIDVPESDRENGTKMDNTLQDIIHENFLNLARKANIQIQEIQRTPQKYSSQRATQRHIIIKFTMVEMKEKMLRAARK